MPLTLEQTITYLKSRCYKYDRGTCALPRCKENKALGALPTCPYDMAVRHLTLAKQRIDNENNPNL